MNSTMKTVLSLAVGFWVGRQVYINYNASQAKAREAHIKKQLMAVFEKSRIKSKQLQEQIEQIFKG
ncbi:hypothetical protein [Aquimarina agarilytica]|uniref:hypothetical protein n=1 Tax=Aquimarina agarilytica TaxID=1087449 RepID=UPI0012F7D9A7|nr:hypothetical protein [Aquimarina agarilytica]